MDITPLVHQILGTLLYLVPIVVLVSIVRSPWFKGIFGEFQVNLATRLRLPKTEYHLIKNVTLPSGNGTTQIDHIIVSRYGVFVGETKNMKGWIFGNPNQKTWTQKIYKHSNKFQNPLHQNYKHVKTLEEELNIPATAIHSVVVFVGGSTFKTKMPENVTQVGGYIRYIKSKRECLLTRVEIDDIVDAIETGRSQPGAKTNRAHVRHLNENRRG